MKRLRAWMFTCAAAFVVSALAQVRPEVGRPLQQAGELLKAGKAREALAKVREADAVRSKTAEEQTTIERMRAAAAQRAGDTATAIRALEAVYSNSSGGEQARIAEALAHAHAQAKNWDKSREWVSRAQRLGAASPQLQQLQAYLQMQRGDHSAVARQAAAAVAAAEQAGRPPEEADLLRLADATQRTGDTAQFASALEKLVLHYGKKPYWNAYLSHLQRKPGFADRLALDVMRLKLVNGLLATPDEYLEMAQLALQAGLPAEGKRIVDQGFTTGLLGTGPGAERHKRLQALAEQQAAESAARIETAAAQAAKARDGNALVELGERYVSMGQPEKGARIIEQGMAKGALKRPDDAKLRLGLAWLQAGQKAKALQILRSVQGNDGTADIARLWAARG